MTITPFNFQAFKEDHTVLFDQNIEKTELCCSQKWARLVIRWGQTNSDEQGRYDFTINLQNGRIFNDDRKTTIYLKFFCLFIYRPIHTLGRLIYRIYELTCAIFEFCINPKNEEIKWEHLVRSLKDLIRIPLYGIVLTILCAAALVFSPVMPTLLYDIRELSGELEKSLNWGKLNDLPCYFILAAPCFQSYDLKESMQDHHNPKKEIMYSLEGLTSDGDRQLLRGLTNLALTLEFASDRKSSKRYEYLSYDLFNT